VGKLALVLFLVPAAFAQDVDRTFHLTKSAVQQQQEIATTLRTVAQIQQLSLDPALAILTVKGTRDQIALAEWLVPKLDVEPGSQAGVQEYKVRANDTLEVFTLVNTSAIMSLNEMVTTLRTVADIQKIYNVTAARMVTLRGNASEIALAKFLVSELDVAPQARQVPSIHESGGGTVVVYGLAHTLNSIGVQEIITNIRTVLNIQKIYCITGSKLLAMRGSPAEIQNVEWLIAALDRDSANAGPNELRLPGGNDDVLHVFYLAHISGNAGVNGLLSSVRSTTHIMRAYERSTPAALVLRGTADQIAMAGRMIEISDR
jgi:hypothetical protein